MVHQRSQRPESVLLAQDDLVVVGSEALGNPPRFRSLVVLLVSRKADREARQLTAVLPNQTRDRRGVHASTQQHADGHVAHEARLDRCVEQLPYAAGRGMLIVLGKPAWLGQRPVPRDLDAARIAMAFATGRQFVDPPVERFGRRCDRIRQVRAKHVPIHLALNRGVLEQRLDLGGEHERAVARGPVQGFLPDRIAGEEEAPAPFIPNHEREHAGQVLDAGIAVALIEVQDHLGVAVRAEARSLGDEPLAQLGIVVDLPVEHEAGPVRPEHGLCSVLEVDDRQPPVAQPYAPVRAHEYPLAVRSAVAQRVPHAHDELRRDRARAVRVLEYSGYSTHCAIRSSSVIWPPTRTDSSSRRLRGHPARCAWAVPMVRAHRGFRA